ECRITRETVSRRIRQPWIEAPLPRGRVRLFPLTGQPAQWPRRRIPPVSFLPLRVGNHSPAEWERERSKSGRVVATIREIRCSSEAMRVVLWVGFFLSTFAPSHL